ncbi:MAG: hypothetical protein CVV33_03995 [Methanomicrobiales archaeon HGW-Methanomicrobiales-4]|nr:MAG: hypothetical protein CVV33_03995 [Methanomicrobiales archaeon HGW-Methanomicrobiales-4]
MFYYQLDEYYSCSLCVSFVKRAGSRLHPGLYRASLPLFHEHLYRLPQREHRISKEITRLDGLSRDYLSVNRNYSDDLLTFILSIPKFFFIVIAYKSDDDKKWVIPGIVCINISNSLIRGKI